MMLDKHTFDRRKSEGAKPSGMHAASQCRPEWGEGMLREAYGLTAAEERLALLILHGLQLGEAEVALGIRHSTARTHMKRIYAKTGTRRQVELVRLLMTAM